MYTNFCLLVQVQWLNLLLKTRLASFPQTKAIMHASHRFCSHLHTACFASSASTSLFVGFTRSYSTPLHFQLLISYMMHYITLCFFQPFCTTTGTQYVVHLLIEALCLSPGDFHQGLFTFFQLQPSQANWLIQPVFYEGLWNENIL